MNKIDLASIASIQNVQTINANFQLIADVINGQMLSRDPQEDVPNYLNKPLDMNGQKFLNLRTPTAPDDVIRKGDLDPLYGKHSVLVDRDMVDQHPIVAITGLQAALDSKQNALVSGANIKTVGGQSILGTGDISLSVEGSAADWSLQTTNFTVAFNKNHIVTTSSVRDVTLPTLVAGKYVSILNSPASTASVRILKPGITVSSSVSTVGTADDILLAPGDHFYAVAVSPTILRLTF